MQQQRVFCFSCAGTILAAIFIGGLFGCRSPIAEPNDSTVISGVVKDSVGLSVPNAIVEVRELNNTIVAVDTSGINGEFSFTEAFAQPQQKVIQVYHPDFNPFSQNLAEAISSSANLQSLRLLLRSGEGSCVQIPIEVVYQKEQGNIYKPATGAEIRLFSQGKFRSKAIFDSNWVNFTSLPVGAFRIEIIKPGFRLGVDDVVFTECGNYPITFQIYPE